MTAEQRRRVRGMAREVLRLWQAWLATIVLLVVVFAVAPQQVPIVAYKGALITLGAISGFWLDRWVFPKIRSETNAIDRMHAMYRRAALMAAGMLAFGLGA
jgi:hypothetical protein